MPITIKSSENGQLPFQLLPCLSGFTIDIRQEITDRLNGEQLTRDTALKILKNIEWQATAKGFLSSPTVILPLSGTLFVASCLIPFASIPTGIAKFVCCATFGTLFGFSMENSLLPTGPEGRPPLPLLSEQYRTLANEAAGYIQQIESQPNEAVIVFEGV
jgi:hypothetical protein